MTMPTTVWYVQIVFDRKVAMPGETMTVTFALQNALTVPIYIADLTWNSSFYDVSKAVVQDVKKVVEAQAYTVLGSGTVRVPDVRDGQYYLDVALKTYCYDVAASSWIDLGVIAPSERKPFLVVHSPRYRAFVSRSSRDQDRPVGDAISEVITSWGFDVHTVGINEIEPDPAKVNERVLQEIIKADAVFAVASPRDVSATTNIVKTFAWLNTEASMAFAARKPLLLLVDEAVSLDGLPAGPQIASMRYSPKGLSHFLSELDVALPIVRNYIQRTKEQELRQVLVQIEQRVAYGAFVAGRVIQTQLLP